MRSRQARHGLGPHRPPRRRRPCPRMPSPGRHWPARWTSPGAASPSPPPDSTSIATRSPARQPSHQRSPSPVPPPHRPASAKPATKSNKRQLPPAQPVRPSLRSSCEHQATTPDPPAYAHQPSPASLTPTPSPSDHACTEGNQPLPSVRHGSAAPRPSSRCDQTATTPRLPMRLPTIAIINLAPRRRPASKKCRPMSTADPAARRRAHPATNFRVKNVDQCRPPTPPPAQRTPW